MEKYEICGGFLYFQLYKAKKQVRLTYGISHQDNIYLWEWEIA
jgi:hypothetical protein